ncbi:maturase [Tanacetum coccineum]|uniref:Maturase n=1 Tax=Tanacetum coccineum TaxID=301880 RepID=A0ABQ5DNX2_9ASTR
MKEAIRMVLESIYDPEFPDTSHFRSGRGCHSALRRIKEEWGTSRWFLEFDIRKCFHTIDRHRLIPIFKEEIGDPKFFYPIQKVFSAGRLVGAEKGPYSVPHSVLLSALPDNIYLHKLDQEIGRIQQKYEIPIVQRIRSVLLRTGRIDDQEDSGEEASFNPPQDNRAIIVGRVKSIQRKAAFHSLVSSWHTPPTSTPRLRGDQKRSFVFPPSSALAAFLNKPSSLLCAAFLIETAGLTPKAEFYGRERCNNNWAMPLGTRVARFERRSNV